MSSKIVICGVNTATLPKISDEQALLLLKAIKMGDENARGQFIVADMLGISQSYISRLEKKYSSLKKRVFKKGVK